VAEQHGTMSGVIHDNPSPETNTGLSISASQAPLRGRAVLLVGLVVILVLAAWWILGVGGVANAPNLNAESGACVGQEDEGTTYRSGYRVTDGQLGSLCFGVEDPRLVNAFSVLSSIVPAGQLLDLSSFTGFTQDGGGDLLAYVARADETGSTFEMAINVNETDDTDELNLTMVHEFTHIFTATPNELDRSVEEEKCNTYWNGEGCYLEDSVMAAWVELFWVPALAGFDPLAPEDDNGGEERCRRNAGFFGPYSATSPEEDFAEAFSAFVFDIEPLTEGQRQRLDWIADQRGLVEFRTRAVAAGFENQPHNFEACGI